MYGFSLEQTQGVVAGTGVLDSSRRRKKTLPEGKSKKAPKPEKKAAAKKAVKPVKKKKK